MSEEEKETIEQLKSWREYIVNHRDSVNKANDIEFYLRTALNLIEEQQNKIESLQKEIKLMKSININDNYVSKDKIIEILDKEREKARNRYNSNNYNKNTIQINLIDIIKKKLLEED